MTPPTAPPTNECLSTPPPPVLSYPPPQLAAPRHAQVLSGAWCVFVIGDEAGPVEAVNYCAEVEHAQLEV